MDFARRQLEKYGWTDGKGLGKHESGIAKPLQSKLKRSTTGLGHDVAAELNDHWWSTLYDQAASNVEVKNKTKISTKDPQAFAIGSSSWHITKKSRGDVSGFVRTAVLTSGGVHTERLHSASESEEEAAWTAITDEELFEACGGRTAHKGARHGIRAKGKLARIEEQEKLLLAMPKYKGYSQAIVDENVENIHSASAGIDSAAKIKTRKNKQKHFNKNETETPGAICVETPDTRASDEVIISKKKRKCMNEEGAEAQDHESDETVVNNKVKKNKNKNKYLNEETIVENGDKLEIATEKVALEVSSKKSRKKKGNIQQKMKN